jgi:lipoyl(octanoyl) transferase
MANNVVQYSDLGKVDYKECWDFQERIFKSIIDNKIFNRNHSEKAIETKNYLIFCEHPHVYTLGKSGSETNLLISEEQRTHEEIQYYKINRGGDITYHGPGQIVAYPLLDLDQFFTDIHKYLRFLEEAVILTLKDYGINGSRVDGLTGVWIDGENPLKARKICAFGVKSSRWVTMHGLAFNVNVDLNYFENIVPCGIEDKSVTSLHIELGRAVNINETKEILLSKLELLFEMSIERVSQFSLNEI